MIAYLETHLHAYLFPSSPASDEALYDSLLTEANYQDRRARCMQAEAIVLRTVGYQIHVALPHALCINYIQTLGALLHAKGRALAAQAFAHLNSLLLSPQLVYLTHQPNCLATAAIYLAAKDVGMKLPELPWWEIFDTDREELGFLCASMTSMAAFTSEEEEKWQGKFPPLTANEVVRTIQARQDTNGQA